LSSGKFYSSNYGLDTFNLDGSDYTRVIQNTYANGQVQYDEASQRVYWQEENGNRYRNFFNPDANFTIRSLKNLLHLDSTVVLFIRASMQTAQESTCSQGCKVLPIFSLLDFLSEITAWSILPTLTRRSTP
jgi:hypothetical protein